MPQAPGAARAIGYFSLGVAAVAWLAPGPIAHVMGYGERPGLVRALGTRDLVVGLGLITAERVAPWLRARLACEVADVLLHTAGALNGAFARKRAVAIAVGAAAFGVLDYALLREAERP